MTTDLSPNKPLSKASPTRPSPRIAKIWEERCTGCEACIAVAPWEDCIVKTGQDPNQPFGLVVCDIQETKCTGCTLCAKICPWDAIEMVPRAGAEKPSPK